MKFSLKRRRSVIFRVGSVWAKAASRLHGRNFSRGWSTSEIEQLLDQSQCTLLVACPVGTKADLELGETQENQTIGFCLFRQTGTGPHSEAEILSIAVEKNWRKQSVGEALMRETVFALKKDDVASLFLEVNNQNQAAVGLYTKLGFEIVGERVGYYVEPPQNTEKSVPSEKKTSAALVMRLDLTHLSSAV